MEEKIYGYWLPVDISTHGQVVDRLINGLHVFMLALFVGWGIFFVYCLFRYRKGANPKATYEPVKGKLSKYVEIGVVVVEAVLLIGISMPLWAQFKQAFPAESEALVVLEQLAIPWTHVQEQQAVEVEQMAALGLNSCAQLDGEVWEPVPWDLKAKEG